MSRHESTTKILAPDGTFGALIRHARLSKGLSALSAANMTNCSATNWAGLEGGLFGLSPERVPVIAKELGILPEVAAWTWVSTYAAALVPALMKTVYPGDSLQLLCDQLRKAREHAARVAAAAATAQNVEAAPL